MLDLEMQEIRHLIKDLRQIDSTITALANPERTTEQMIRTLRNKHTA